MSLARHPRQHSRRAETTALSMLIEEMPELGTLEGKQAASLAGLSYLATVGEVARQGAHPGGRTVLRRAIYMPALVARARPIRT